MQVYALGESFILESKQGDPKTMRCITCADCHPHFVFWPVDFRFVSTWSFYPAAVYSNWTMVGCFG